MQYALKCNSHLVVRWTSHEIDNGAMENSFGYFLSNRSRNVASKVIPCSAVPEVGDE